MNVSDAIYQRIKCDSPCVFGLGIYQTEPSLFVSEVVPADVLPEAHGPIALVPEFPFVDDDTAINQRRQAYRIRIYGADGEAVRDLGVNIRNALHRWGEATGAGRVILSTASGPVAAPTSDPNVIGAAVTVSILIKE